MMTKNLMTITSAVMRKYAVHLKEQERAAATIQKYVHDVAFASSRELFAGSPAWAVTPMPGRSLLGVAGHGLGRGAGCHQRHHQYHPRPPEPGDSRPGGRAFRRGNGIIAPLWGQHCQQFA